MKPTVTDPRIVEQNKEKTKKTRLNRALKRATEGRGVGGARLHGRSASPPLELYQRESCPFSHAVRNKLSELGLDFVAHNVSEDNPLKHEQLAQAGGKDQIPFLIDHASGVKLYESGAIIAYLENEYGPAPETTLDRYFRDARDRVRARADQLLWRARQPLERYQRFRHDADELMETLRGVYQMLRQRLGKGAEEPPVAPSAGPAAAGDELDGGELEREVA